MSSSNSNERISSNIYLVNFFIYCPLLCEKEGQVGKRKIFFSTFCLFYPGGKKNSLFYTGGRRARATSSNRWLLWRFSEIYWVSRSSNNSRKLKLFSTFQNFWFRWIVRKCSFQKDSFTFSQSWKWNLFCDGKIKFDSIRLEIVSFVFQDVEHSGNRTKERWKICHRILRWIRERSNYSSRSQIVLSILRCQSVNVPVRWITFFFSNFFQLQYGTMSSIIEAGGIEELRNLLKKYFDRVKK